MAAATMMAASAVHPDTWMPPGESVLDACRAVRRLVSGDCHQPTARCVLLYGVHMEEFHTSLGLVCPVVLGLDFPGMILLGPYAPTVPIHHGKLE